MHRIPRILQFISILFLTAVLSACGLIAAQIDDVSLADPLSLNGREFHLSSVNSWYEPESGTAGGLQAAASLNNSLLTAGIFTGDGMNGLDGNMTRAQYARVAALLLGLSGATEPATSLTDIAANHWAYGWVSANLPAYGGNFTQYERDYQDIALRAWNDAFSAGRAPEPDAPAWFKPLVIEVKPEEVDLGGHDWIISQIKSFSQPVSITSFTVTATDESVTAPASLLLRGLSLRVMVATRGTNGQLNELTTLKMDSAFEEPIEYLAGSGGRYRAAQGLSIDPGELKLTASGAVKLFGAFLRQETLTITVDLGVMLEAESFDGLDMAFELGAGDAIISFRK